MSKPLNTWKDRILFTPGPLTTSRTVKQAMLRDLGSRDSEFMELTQTVRQKLVALAGESESEFTSVLLPGSGTYAVESVLTSSLPADGKVLVISNGAYGHRMGQIASVARLNYTLLSYAEDQRPDLKEIETTLAKDPAITHIAMVHCETTSGILNPIEEVGALARQFGKSYFVDAMSSFGAARIPMKEWNIDYLVSSANKCIESVPGLSFVIARREALMKTEGLAKSLSLDLFAQWKDLESKSEFRFTPPIQVVIALDQALDELTQEGGAEARAKRYQDNHRTLLSGMRELGFKTYLETEKDMGYIITSFHYLDHPKFDYKSFYERLRERDIVVYSGKVSNAACFRVGNIGRIFKADIQNLLLNIRQVLNEMGIA